MKKFILTSIGLIQFIASNAQLSCDDAFSAANYSVAHTTNAYESNNNDHVQEWSYKAIETFREVEDITISCGCEDAANLAYEGYEAAEKAQEQNTWERSRFYAKRANEKAKLMMDALAECSNSDISKIKNSSFEDNEYASNEDDNPADYYSNDNAEAKKIEVAKLKAERDAEIQKQLVVKLDAETALRQINAGYQSLANALGCKQAYEMAKSSYEYTIKQINSNTLTDTKMHYTLKLNEIAEKAMLNFSDCASGF